MRVMGGVLLIVLLLAGAGVVYLYSGAYNVAASVPHSTLGNWIFSTAMEGSVRQRAKDIEAPDLKQAGWVEQGFSHYTDNCAGCHGAPGVERNEVGEGLTPKPPKLAEEASEWEPHELFWIIKHGIKMTGMPAWGASHSDEQIWQLVAFVKALPQLDAQAYRRLQQEVGGAHGGEGDGHGGHAH